MDKAAHKHRDAPQDPQTTHRAEPTSRGLSTTVCTITITTLHTHRHRGGPRNTPDSSNQTQLQPDQDQSHLPALQHHTSSTSYSQRPGSRRQSADERQDPTGARETAGGHEGPSAHLAEERVRNDPLSSWGGGVV
ncbi:hypothetical protein SKAU_G00368520 [Synaphobranchus kaupii]|uniref:Uncharacterized protein n=1 Tax=Synaphobranchus kaupii TaxID=118154 RepID=A0A9Q1EFK5_SYNKA|nr:hypothetical protein SKAU_G00368520 [Synaphobranchus kaupii]